MPNSIHTEWEPFYKIIHHLQTVKHFSYKKIIKILTKTLNVDETTANNIYLSYLVNYHKLSDEFNWEA